jgi:hypothetical protein
MFTKNKNISRLNSLAAGLFGISGFGPENVFTNKIDSRTLIAAVVLLIITAAVLSIYNKIKERREKSVRSKLSHQ